MTVVLRACLLAVIASLPALPASALDADRGCPTPDTPIVTDRPDVTNSSLVVPGGSLQVENGINGAVRRDAGRIDGTNTRLRLGVFGCTELVLDLPSWSGVLAGRGPSGFTNLAPGVKHQLGPLPGDIELSIAAGLGLPTGARRIAGPGPQPYLQFPWSRELVDGWGVSGMVTLFWLPDRSDSDAILENNVVLSRELTETTDLFVEFVGDYPRDQRPQQQVNLGGAWRVTPTQQLDFHGGFGVGRETPRWFVGIGYSFRYDRLF
jgi:hypothetical protein